MKKCVLFVDWLDLWVSDRGYSHWFQDALPGVEINLLHATSASLQRISTHQSVWPIESSASMGTWFSGDLSQPTLPFMVWLWRGFEVPRKTCLHKHHSVPSHITATDCLLHTACCLPADWQIHHSHCMFLQLTLSFDTYNPEILRPGHLCSFINHEMLYFMSSFSHLFHKYWIH